MLWDEDSGHRCKGASTPVDQPEGSQASFATGLEESENPFNAPDLVRLRRIQELRIAIAEGTYRVPAAKIAESLIRFAKRHSGTYGRSFSAW